LQPATLSYKSEHRFFQTELGVIHYEELMPDMNIEEPETVVLLHNFMATGRSVWEPLLPRLGQQYRILLIDLPGHGQSVGHPPGFHHETAAYHLAALLESENATQGHIVGYSSGGMLTQLMLHHGLIEPASITLLSTTYTTNWATIGQGEHKETRVFQANDRWMEESAKLHDPYHYPGYFAEVLVEGFRQLEMWNTIDLPLSVLREWSLPVCVIHGENDADFPMIIAQNAAEALPNAQLHIIPEQRHSLIFRQPQVVEDIILKFLTEV